MTFDLLSIPLMSAECERIFSMTKRFIESISKLASGPHTMRLISRPTLVAPEFPLAIYGMVQTKCSSNQTC
jgi:hypothetical protein